VLVQYDPKPPLTLACDAVLQHIMPNGEKHPITHASPSLSPAENKYWEHFT